jgi:hypothetical protein
VRYLFLLFLKALSHTFYKVESRWLDPTPQPPWKRLRVLVFLHHTSLYEWLFVAVAPNHLLKRVANHGLIPIAQKTYDRALVGSFYKVLAPQMVPISREPDHTWEDVMGRIDDEAMVIIAPEGRMMRADGLDSKGQPMTVRGGIADILRAVPEGEMLLAISGGLHHVQVPGQRFPRLFKPVRMSIQYLDIPTYKREIGVGPDERGFKKAVKRDLEERRDALRPPEPPAAWPD